MQQKGLALVLAGLFVGTILSAGIPFQNNFLEEKSPLEEAPGPRKSSSNSSVLTKNWTSAEVFSNLVTDSRWGATSCRNTGSSTIVVGTFDDYSVTLGNTSVINSYTTRDDIVYGSYNDNGTWNWVKSIGGTGFDSISSKHPFCNDEGDFVMTISGSGQIAYDENTTLVFGPGTTLGGWLLVSFDKFGYVNWFTNVSTNIFDANNEFIYGTTAQNITKIDWDGNIIWEKQRPQVPYHCGSTNWGNTLSPKLITANESILYTENCQMESEMTIGDCNTDCWEFDIDFEYAVFYVVSWNDSGNFKLGWSGMIQSDSMGGNWQHNIQTVNNKMIIWGSYSSYELDLFNTSYYNIEAGNEYDESFLLEVNLDGNISSMKILNGTGRHDIKKLYTNYDYTVIGLYVGQQDTFNGVSIQQGRNWFYIDHNLNQTILLDFNNNNHVDISSVSFDRGGNVSFVFYDMSGGYQFGNHSVNPSSQSSVIATFAGDVVSNQNSTTTPSITELSNWTVSPNTGPSEGGTELTITGDFSSLYNLWGGSIGAQTEINHSWSNSLIRDLGENIRCFSIAADSNDNLHVAFIANSKLYYVSDAQDYNHRMGYAQEITTTTGGGHQECEIGIDSGGNPHIAYRYSQYIMYTYLDNGNWTTPSIAGHLQGLRALEQMIINDNDDIYLLAYDSPNSSLKLFFKDISLWSNYTIDYSGSVRPYGASMYIDNSGYIHVAYYHDYGNNNLELMYTKLNMQYSESIVGFWDLNSTIDSSVINVCRTSIAVDSNYVTHVTYARETEIDTTSINLIHAYANNTGTGIFTSELIDSNQAGGSSSMVIDNEDNLYVIYTAEAADFEVRFGKYNQDSWNLTQFSQNESNGHEIYMVLDSSKNLHAVYNSVHPNNNNGNLEYLFGNSGFVQYSGLYAQFDEYGNNSIQFINNSTLKVITPSGPTNGAVVNITIWDELGNGYILNAAYTYLPASLDIDNDGFDNDLDDCPGVAGTSTMDKIGCPDSDGDGYSDSGDLFPSDSGEWADSDGDGVGNNGDQFPNDSNESQDSDGDGLGDNADAFPNDANETTDSDSDGVGDNSDAFPFDGLESLDSDGDGVGDNADAFPLDANETQDTDGDGIGDNEDEYPFLNNYNDSDGDSFFDIMDDFPEDSTQWADYDGDGYGDNPSGNNSDAFINNATQWSDTDGDGFGDNWGNPEWNATRLFIWPGQYMQGAELADHCPTEFGNSTADGYFGCPDLDGDGIADMYDDIVELNSGNTTNETTTVDTDGDGVADLFDLCPATIAGGFVDIDGCLLDKDGDGVDDLNDACPRTPSGAQVSINGCIVEKNEEKSFIESLRSGEQETVLKTVGFGAVMIAVLGFLQTNMVAALLPDSLRWIRVFRTGVKLNQEEIRELEYLKSLVQTYYLDLETLQEELYQLKSELSARYTNSEIKKLTKEKLSTLINDLLNMEVDEVHRVAHNDAFFGLGGALSTKQRTDYLAQEALMRVDDEPANLLSFEAATPSNEFTHPTAKLKGEVNENDGYEYLEHPSGSGKWYYRTHAGEPWNKWNQ